MYMEGRTKYTEVALSASLSRALHWYDVKILRLVETFGSLDDLYRTWHTNPDTLPQLLVPSLEKAWNETELNTSQDLLARYEVRAVLLGEEAYPHLLSNITDPPYVLYYKGDISVAQSHCIAMVGTRGMTLYGKRSIDYLVTGLQGLSLTVVSGLALGVDAAVHNACLDHSVATLAVLGGGVDRFEPITNSAIGKRIVESGGCVVSEYPPGVRPEKHHFLARNRIIAGMSSMTIVIEGKAHSGSLVTARSALSYGRDVGVLPGDIFSPQSAGPLLLLEEGAWPIVSPTSILRAINLEPAMLEVVDDETHPLVKLLVMPLTIDELVTRSGLSLREVQGQLTELELLSRVSVTPTGTYYKK